MNEDIERTVNNNNTQLNQSGGKRTFKKNNNISKKETNLTKKIRLLKLKLTKNKLQNQLKQNNNNTFSKKIKKHIKNKK